MHHQLKEADLFEIVKAHLLPDLQSAENEYSKWDCVSDAFGMYIELKCRDTHYPDLLIEKIKWDALHAQARSRGYRPIYINSTPEGIFVFVLSEVPTPGWTQRLMPATTQFRNRKKVLKEVGFLPVGQAKKAYDLPAAGEPLLVKGSADLHRFQLVNA